MRFTFGYKMKINPLLLGSLVAAVLVALVATRMWVTHQVRNRDREISHRGWGALEAEIQRQMPGQSESKDKKPYKLEVNFEVPEFVPPADTPERRAEMEAISKEFQHSIDLSNRLSTLEDSIRSSLTTANGEQARILQHGLTLVEDMSYFASATDNSGQIFTFVGYLSERRTALEELGAMGCLKALDGLLPYHQEELRLADEEAMRRHFFDTQAEREPFEAFAEDQDELRELLIRYAEQTMKLAEHKSAHINPLPARSPKLNDESNPESETGGTLPVTGEW